MMEVEHQKDGLNGEIGLPPKFNTVGIRQVDFEMIKEIAYVIRTGAVAESNHSTHRAFFTAIECEVNEVRRNFVRYFQAFPMSFDVIET